MIERVSGIYSFLRIFFKKSFHQVQPFGRNLLVHIFGEIDFASSILSQNFIIFRSWEWWFSQGNHMEDDSNTEKIANWVILSFQIFQVNDLWSHIARSTASYKQVLFFFAVGRKPKISNDTIIIIVFSQDDVLRFEISVHDFLVMHVLQSLKESFHDRFDLGRSELVFRLNLVIQLSTLQQLNLNVDGVLRLID